MYRPFHEATVNDLFRVISLSHLSQRTPRKNQSTRIRVAINKDVGKKLRQKNCDTLTDLTAAISIELRNKNIHCIATACKVLRYAAAVAKPGKQRIRAMET